MSRKYKLGLRQHIDTPNVDIHTKLVHHPGQNNFRTYERKRTDAAIASIRKASLAQSSSCVHIIQKTLTLVVSIRDASRTIFITESMFRLTKSCGSAPALWQSSIHRDLDGPAVHQLCEYSHETQTQDGHDVHIVIWCDNTTRSARSVSRSVSSIPRAVFKLAQHNSSAAYRLCLSTGGFSRSSDVEVGAIAAGFAGPSGSRIRAAVRDSLTRT